MRAVVGEGGEGIVGGCRAHGVARHDDFGILLAPHFVEAAEGVVGLFHARADGKLERDAEAPVILRGHELGANVFHQEYGADEDAEADDDGDGAVCHHAAQQRGIAVVELVECFLDGPVQDAVEARMVGLPAEPLAAEHRGQRQGAGGGDDHHDADHPSQLAEEHSRHAGDERQREEHGYQRQRGGYYRDGHLVGAVDGRLFRVGAAFYVRRHVLEHHDGVVHHHTDGDGQCRQRDDVQRVAGGVEVDEGGNQRNRDGDDDNHRGSPAPQEYEDHYHHEEQGVEHGLFERGDGVANIVGGIDYDSELDVRGEVLLQLGEHLHHLFGNLHRIGAGLLLDDYHGSLFPAYVCLLRALLEGVFHARHVAEVDGASLHRCHGDVLQLAGIVELTLHAQRVGVGADVERATRRIAVFGAYYLRDGLHVDVVSLEFLRVHIDVDFAFRRTGDGDGTHAVDTRKRVGHGVVEYLVKPGHALVGLHRKETDGNHVGGEFEDDGVFGVVGKRGFHHVELVAHVVGEHVYVVAVFKFQRDYRSVFAALAGDVLEVLHGVEGVLQGLGDVLLYVFGAGARIHGDDHQRVGLDVRVEVDGEFGHREEAEYDYGHEAERRHDRAFYRTSV